MKSQGTLDKFQIKVYPWRFYIFGMFAVVASLMTSILVLRYLNHDNTIRANLWLPWMLIATIFFFGLCILGLGEVETFFYNKILKIVILEKSSWFSTTKIKMKKSQIKNIDVEMRGSIERLRNDIYYTIVFETIKGKNYKIFPTGDRKKVKERYYEIKRVMGYELDYTSSLSITKKLRNVDEDLTKSIKDKTGKKLNHN
jgi:hypothetical protein